MGRDRKARLADLFKYFSTGLHIYRHGIIRCMVGMPVHQPHMLSHANTDVQYTVYSYMRNIGLAWLPSHCCVNFTGHPSGLSRSPVITAKSRSRMNASRTKSNVPFPQTRPTRIKISRTPRVECLQSCYVVNKFT